MKPTTESDLKMSDIIPTDEVDDTSLGMLYIIIVVAREPVVKIKFYGR